MKHQAPETLSENFEDEDLEDRITTPFLDNPLQYEADYKSNYDVIGINQKNDKNNLIVK